MPGESTTEEEFVCMAREDDFNNIHTPDELMAAQTRMQAALAHLTQTGDVIYDRDKLYRAAWPDPG